MPRKLKFKFLVGLAVCVIVLLVGLQSTLQAAALLPSPQSIPSSSVISQAEQDSFELPADWQPVPSHRDDRRGVKVVWLQGTPYEMGYQHGTLLHDEIGTLGREVISGLRLFGRGLGLGQFSLQRTYPDTVAECEGLVAATKDLGMTLDACLVLAFGDVYQEFFTYTLPDILFHDGCSNFVMAGAATADGRLYHGRSLEQNGKPLGYWLKNTTVFVRQPNDGLPHMFISVPGMVWPNSGMNIEGITTSLDTAHPIDVGELALYGRSNVQLMAQIMKHAKSYNEARQFLEAERRMRANLIIVSDGQSHKAGVFEMTGRSMAVREISDDGVLYMTNHFADPAMVDKDSEPLSDSTLPRFDRFKQLLEPGERDSHYGQVTPNKVVEILRDRINPYTFKESPADIYDDDSSIGTNGSLRQVVFDPERLRFWVASGKVPVPQQPFVCFSLGEMLGLPNAVPCEAPVIR
jgi:hypothetical protein